MHNINKSDSSIQPRADFKARRRFIKSAGITTLSLAAGLSNMSYGTDKSYHLNFKPIVPPPDKGESPWGNNTYKEPTPRPPSLLPGELHGLPEKPRAYTRIKSYHAHIYFNNDSYDRAVLLRKWVVERFPVELGDWNVGPRGPHVTPSFYFGFTNDLLPIIIPWLQLNSLGLTILLHPNSDNPRADHLYYAMWINRSQPVNAYDMPEHDQVEKILPNIKPTIKLET